MNTRIEIFAMVARGELSVDEACQELAMIGALDLDDFDDDYIEVTDEQVAEIRRRFRELVASIFGPDCLGPG